MIKTEFSSPTGQSIINIDMLTMKKHIIDEFPEYWNQGSGDGLIKYYEDDINKYSLIIGPNEKHGIYLQYISDLTNEYWLSLEDESALHEVAETADEIYASVGLFLPVEKAWEGIKKFLMTGKRSDKIRWVRPDIIPDDGNW